MRTLAGRSSAATAQEKRDSDTLRTDNDVNPFLPYEPDMLVADISPTHVCLLNKFTVIDYHLLVVTRAYEDQQSLLTLEDFVALGACMAEIDGLAFYNAGRTAGASQRHKHLQLVPLPLAPIGLPIPIEPALGLDMLGRGIQRAARLPFRHALTRLDPGWWERPQDAAAPMLGIYRAMLREVNLAPTEAGDQPGSYNLLLTRRWMLLAPRAAESYAGISVNALGFAGCLLVHDRQQLALLKRVGPMTVLQQVARK